ncbi:MAG: PH domain-containing protein [Clostridia bacterium]|nr:PH domain-containing protein [Clostridia bacterium]MBQ8720084.1 PH domain-containing protein [Clostridia bacterium]
MENKRFKPLVDRLFWITLAITLILLATMSAVVCFSPAALFIIIPVDLAVVYLLLTSLFGYVELRESSVFVKFGLIMKREIPYGKIRGAFKERKLYSDSMLSLKNALEHVNIKYNSFDVTTVSVVDNESFCKELEARLGSK